MTVAHLNQKGGVAKTMRALHPAGEWAREGKRVVLIDAAAQGSALDWSEQCEKEGFRRLFGVLGLARGTLHREAPELAHDADHVVINGPPHTAGLTRSALLAADLVLITAQSSPFDGWASGEMLKLADEARIFRPQLIARFVLNRCVARTVIARETAEAMSSTSRRGAPRVSVSASALPMSRDPAATERSPKHGFAAHPGDPEAWVRAPEPSTTRTPNAACTAPLTFDVTPALRGRIKIAAFHRGLTVADMLRTLLVDRGTRS